MKILIVMAQKIWDCFTGSHQSSHIGVLCYSHTDLSVALLIFSEWVCGGGWAGVCVMEVLVGIVTRLSACIILSQLGGLKITRWVWSPEGEQKTTRKKITPESFQWDVNPVILSDVTEEGVLSSSATRSMIKKAYVFIKKSWLHRESVPFSRGYDLSCQVPQIQLLSVKSAKVLVLWEERIKLINCRVIVFLQDWEITSVIF